MKFTVTFKDPDTLDESILSEVKAEVAKLGLDADEAGLVVDSRCEKVRAACSKWFEYGEYVRIEVDTDAGTATVVPYR